jgi:hypothetical protein
MGYLCFHNTDEKMYDEKLHELSEKSIMLMRKNDSLDNINKKLNIKIDSIQKETEVLKGKSVALDSTLKSINNKRNEIPNYIKRLSANGVSDEFTKYLNEKTKSRNPN